MFEVTRPNFEELQEDETIEGKIKRIIKGNIMYDYTDAHCIKGMVDVYTDQLAAAIVKEIRGK